MRGLALALALCCALGATARAEERPKQAQFVLILGVNRGFDRTLAQLRYADDDAARYLELFRSLGARAYLLTDPDENTTRLHPQATAEAREPSRRELERAVAAIAADVAQARARQLETVFYFVYAGHGSLQRGNAVLELSDAHLDARDLERDVVARVGADRVHLIVDACYSYFLAYSRGPGGERRTIGSLGELSGLARRPGLGLLLSTSSARESHEWEAFQSGVFSHEVRSGLYGAADADGDGQVSYREIAAFVDRANGAIPNERFRPNVYAKPPVGKDELLDLRAGLERRIQLDGTRQGHQILEDAQGVRIVEFNNRGPLHLVRPGGTGTLYLARADGTDEVAIAPSDGVVQVASLESRPSRVQQRGAVHEAFGSIFALPFDREAERGFVLRAPVDPYALSPVERRALLRRDVGIGVASVGGTALLSGLALTISAYSIRDATGLSGADTAARGATINSLNTGAIALYAVGGVAALSSIILLALPPRWSPGRLAIGLTPSSGAVSYTIDF